MTLELTGKEWRVLATLAQLRPLSRAEPAREALRFEAPPGSEPARNGGSRC